METEIDVRPLLREAFNIHDISAASDPVRAFSNLCFHARCFGLDGDIAAIPNSTFNRYISGETVPHELVREAIIERLAEIAELKPQI